MPLCDFSPEEQAEREIYEARDYYPNPDIVGRDLEILEIETKIAQRNILLIRGCTGIGKTTLVKHLAWWWQNTYGVAKVFYFGYDEKLWTLKQVLKTIAQELKLAEQQTTIVNSLVKQRHLLIFDALECINKSEQTALHEFLMRLQNGKSLILLSSQQNVKWLAKDTFGDNVYELAGIDNRSANILITSRLKSHDISYVQLEKNPLLLKIAIQATLENETALLSVLKTTMSNTDKQGEAKQKYILHEAINYINNNLTLNEQGLLLCLAPLKFAININTLSEYSQLLRQQAVLAHLPFENLEKVLEKMLDWGLLRLSPDVLLQSAFGDFLRSCLDEKLEWLEVIKTTYVQCSDVNTNIQNNSLGIGIKIGGMFENFSLEIVSSNWARYDNKSWVKSGWLYTTNVSGVSHAVAFFKILLLESGNGYIHILDTANPVHTIWLETNTNFRQEQQFCWKSEHNIKRTYLWWFNYADNKKFDLPILSQIDTIGFHGSIKRIQNNDLGMGIRMGGKYQKYSLKLVSSDWIEDSYFFNSWLIKSGWLYVSSISDFSHAVAFFKIHLQRNGIGYIHILDTANPDHTIWLETNTGFRQEQQFCWDSNPNIQRTALWQFTWDFTATSLATAVGRYKL